GSHAHRYDGIGIAHRLAALDLVDIVHSFDDLAPGRVLLVEPGRLVEADEELRIGRVRVHRTSHRARATNMARRGKLCLEVRQLRAAGAGAGWVTRLRHEAIDHAVEDDAVIKAVARKRL